MNEFGHLFADKIESRTAIVGVMGLGYAGLPVALAFSEAGFSVVGIDLDQSRVTEIRQGRSYVSGIDDRRVAASVEGRRLLVSDDASELENADAILITVPTPLLDGAPDLSYIVAAGEQLAKVTKKGALVVLESTTYPGTTEEVLRPLFESNGFDVEIDLFLAYSPERIDPANEAFSFGDIPKVVGAVTEDAKTLATSLYETVVPKVIGVRGTREAEFSKLVENTFRHVNIALVNELAVYANEIGVDIWEAIGAAATKPFGYMPFWPGPGWGGHCIPLDPTFLSWRVRKERAHEIRFVELAHAINSEMARYVVERVTLMLNDQGKPVQGSRILAVGIAYKAGTNDLRESPGTRILRALVARGASVAFHDPLVPELQLGESVFGSTPLDEEALMRHDLVLILVRQPGIDWKRIKDSSVPVFDCCNALGTADPHIQRL